MSDPEGRIVPGKLFLSFDKPCFIEEGRAALSSLLDATSLEALWPVPGPEDPPKGFSEKKTTTFRLTVPVGKELFWKEEISNLSGVRSVRRIREWAFGICLCDKYPDARKHGFFLRLGCVFPPVELFSIKDAVEVAQFLLRHDYMLQEDLEFILYQMRKEHNLPEEEDYQQMFEHVSEDEVL